MIAHVISDDFAMFIIIIILHKIIIIIIVKIIITVRMVRRNNSLLPTKLTIKTDLQVISILKKTISSTIYKKK